MSCSRPPTIVAIYFAQWLSWAVSRIQCRRAQIASVLRPGFFSPIMDWDLLSPLSLLGALLTYILCIRHGQYRVIFVVTGIDLLKTIPWILVNHFGTRVPW